MLATFALELGLAVYVLWRYRSSSPRNLIVLLLICLAIFQKCEFIVCLGDANIWWTRLGLVVITLLPALGIHLVAMITGRKLSTILAYGLASIIIVTIIAVPDYVLGSTCGGNYVLFHTASNWGLLFGLYYCGLLGLGILEAVHHLQSEVVPRLETALLRWIIGGYVSFLLPMGIVYLISEQARVAIPSIMCGFALILAFILAFRVMPLLVQARIDE